MNRDLRNQRYLSEGESGAVQRRPLIGVPTGRERSQRFFGLPLYIMNQTYVRTIENLGALPVLIPLQMTEATLRGIFERLDGLLLPGGEDIDPANYSQERHPQLGSTDSERDRTEMLLARWAIEEGMPMLGVCRGAQVMNVVCGGTLWQDLTTQTPNLAKHDYFPPTFERFRISHQVNIAPDSHLATALGNVSEVNSMHHQGIHEVGAGLRVSAVAEDGLPEAVEVAELPFSVGVQWHPEELAKTDELSAGLFLALVEAASGEWRDDVPEGWRERIRALWATMPQRPFMANDAAAQSSASEAPTLHPLPAGGAANIPAIRANCA